MSNIIYFKKAQITHYPDTELITYIGQALLIQNKAITLTEKDIN